MTPITAANRGRFYPSIIGGRERPERRNGEIIMGVLEIIIIGFIGLNAALGLSSLVTVRR